jgi:hypothetical protein
VENKLSVDLNKLLIFSPAKLRQDSGNLISFSITYNKQRGSTALKFYINKEIAKKINISEHSKILFGCEKENYLKWYLIISNSGYTLRTINKNKDTLFIAVTSPFGYVDKQMQSIPNNKIEIMNNMIGLDVSGIFKKEQLLLIK